MRSRRTPWSKGKLVGQKAPLRLSDIWSVRVRLQLGKNARDLALFNLAIESKLRGCDLVSLRLRDVFQGGAIAKRAIVLQRKTDRPLQFELTDLTRTSVAEWARQAQIVPRADLFPGRAKHVGLLSTRQYARVVSSWVTATGLGRHNYGTHSMRRTKASLIYRRMKNLRAAQILLGHTKLESTVRYLGSRLRMRCRWPSRRRPSQQALPRRSTGSVPKAASDPELPFDHSASTRLIPAAGVTTRITQPRSIPPRDTSRESGRPRVLHAVYKALPTVHTVHIKYAQ